VIVHLKRWAPLLVIVALMATILASGLHKTLSLEAFVKHADAVQAFIGANRVAGYALYVLTYTIVVALSLPGALFMTMIGGMLFDWTVGGPLAVLGATLGAMALFAAARSSLGTFLRERAGGRVAQMAAGFRNEAASYLLFLRLVPLFPFALVNLAAAIFSVPFFTFVWTTAIGILPGTMTFSFAGSTLDTLLAAQKEAFTACKASGATDCRLSINFKALVQKKLLMAFALLGLLALLPVIIRRLGLFRRRAS
jgi:uncharacterized membrane protein YdjX (TVP38/TMEM64 family)